VRAHADIFRIVKYIARDNPVAAVRVARELVTTTPYTIVYRVGIIGSVTILRVWHAAQDR
jgi:plasmid stabilization system protein ParE